MRRLIHIFMSPACRVARLALGEKRVPHTLVPADDPNALAAKIVEVTSQRGRMSAMSERNLTVAQGFSEERLAPPFRQLMNKLLMATVAHRP